MQHLDSLSARYLIDDGTIARQPVGIEVEILLGDSPKERLKSRGGFLRMCLGQDRRYAIDNLVNKCCDAIVDRLARS